MMPTNDQIEFHTLLSKLFLLQSIPTFLFLRFIIVAPFGRHVSNQKKWWFGPQFNPRLSWFIFECPNLVWVWYCSFYRYDPDIFFMQQQQRQTIISLDNNHVQISTNVVLLSLFAIHYINRAIIYPLRMNSNSQKVPLLITMSASIITYWNGYIQCFYLTQIGEFPPLSLSTSLDDIQCWTGIGIFFIGMYINMHSDSVLRNLRRKHGKRQEVMTQQQQIDTKKEHVYYIPHSPFFEYISCPNFSGEILEWFGFTWASRFSLPSVAFFIYTASNLIPRAIAHHEWYRRKFDNYPVDRRWAVIPFVV